MSPDLPGVSAAPSPADVRAALARVARSSPLLRSPQLQRLLSFLVEETLAGRGERLKEYVIGLEVFARPASYDPRVDSLVRVEARRLRAALAAYYTSEGLNDTIVIQLQRGSYVPSFRAAAAPPAPPTNATTSARVQEAPRATRTVRLATLVLILGVIAALTVGVVRVLRSRPVQALTERDTIVLAGFSNSTGDAVFDETLRQGLATELEQSPFLNIVSERRVGQVLGMMGRSASDRLGHEQARDLCLRAGAKVLVAGSLDRVGSHYVLGLTAMECSTGDDVVHVQEEAARKEAVLGSLSAAARALRGRLGESLDSIQQYGIPVEDATTSSLAALQAFSLGRRTAREKGSPADIPFYQRALELDPDFAAAHAGLGVSYANQGQPGRAGEHLERAYRLRDRVSERERYRISAYYHQAVAGDLEKAGEVYELWKQSYPREFAPHVNLGLAHLWLGQYQKALAETTEARRIEPAEVLPYTNLAALFIKIGRPRDGKAVLEQAADRHLTSTFLRLNLCYLAFLEGDASVIERQLAEVRTQPGDEAPLLSLQSDTEAHHGRLGKARALTRQAVQSALRAGSSEAAATWLLNGALREAEFGHSSAARGMVREALALSTGRDATTLAALALARSGDVENARLLLEKLQAQYPLNTVSLKYWRPAIGAAVEVQRGNATRAIELLEAVLPYELGSPPPIGLATLYPVYLRGEAHLRAGNGAAAAREFQKVLDHPGLVLNFPLHALSHLQLARANRLSGALSAARGSYDRFLALWREADPHTPVLRAARAERQAPQPRRIKD